MNSVEVMYFEALKAQYGKIALNRKETAEAIGISLSQLDKLLKAGIGLPNHKRIGRSQKARIIFPLGSVANFLASTSSKPDHSL